MAGKIVEYKIVDHAEAYEVEAEVSKYLLDGWELYGELKVVGFFARSGQGDDQETHMIFSYSQAMVRREESEANFA